LPIPSSSASLENGSLLYNQNLMAIHQNWTNQWLCRSLLLVLVGSAIAGCAQLQPESVTPSSVELSPQATHNPTASQLTGNQAWQSITPGETADGLTFTTDGKLLYQNEPLLVEIPVSYSSDNTVTYAKRLIVSPTSPSGRYSLVKACDRETDEALCWAVYRVDRQHAKVQQVSIGKYGGLEWIQWSSDERYAVFLEKMEGTAWFIVMNLETGESQLSDQLPAQPDLTSFVWTGDRIFNVTLNNGTQFQGNIDDLLAG
jgi:hypothetical protein